jgi:hypothetical protein
MAGLARLDRRRDDPVRQLIGFTLASFVLIVVPGPGVLFIVGRALSHGRRTAFATAAGHAAGNYLVSCLPGDGWRALRDGLVVGVTNPPTARGAWPPAGSARGSPGRRAGTSSSAAPVAGDDRRRRHDRRHRPQELIPARLFPDLQRWGGRRFRLILLEVVDGGD